MASTPVFEAWRDDPAWLDAQYNNRALVPEHEAHFARWKHDSACARDNSACLLDLPYGPKPSQTLDVFPAAKPGSCVVVFIHGGYWRSLDKSDHSFLAPAWQALGHCVLVPNYSLCPGTPEQPVRVGDIALEMLEVVAWVHAHAAQYGGDARRIVLVGHSAGGHLAAMLLALDWHAWGRARGLDLPKRFVRSAVSISGLYDLRPIARVPFLASSLKLSDAHALACSPALMPAPVGARLIAAVGALESAEFKRHNRLIADCWGMRVVPQALEIAQTQHFSVLESAIDPSSALYTAVQRACATVGD
jgi:arylformamidase